MTEAQPINMLGLCYSPSDDRVFLKSIVGTEGVADVLAGSLKVTTGASGLNLSVAQGPAFIDSDADDQGMYQVYNNGAVTLVGGALPGIEPASVANPRVDIIVATVRDNAEFGGGFSDWILTAVTGTPNAAAALTAAGIAASAPAVPIRSVLLAYVLVPISPFAGPFVDATHILDARVPWVSAGEPRIATTKWSRATNLSVANSGETLITYPVGAADTAVPNDFYSESGGTITLKKAGVFDITVEVEWAANSDATMRRLRLYQNVSTEIAENSSPSVNSASLTTTQRFSATVIAARGDTIDLWGSQGSAGSLNITKASLRVTRRGTLTA